MGDKQTCEECGKDFEAERKMKYCRDCADDKALGNLAQIEPPEGGWRRNSDMDRL